MMKTLKTLFATCVLAIVFAACGGSTYYVVPVHHTYYQNNCYYSRCGGTPSLKVKIKQSSSGSTKITITTRHHN